MRRLLAHGLLNFPQFVPLGLKTMRSRNYTKEIGLNTEQRRVPMFVTIGIFALVVTLALLFARQVNSLHHTAAETPHAAAEVKVTSR